MIADKIRVAYCIDNMQVGGTELNAVRTAEILNRDRFELRVVSLQQSGPMVARYEAAGIPVHYIPLHSLYKPSVLRGGRELVRLLKTYRVDVLHAHDVYSNCFGVVFGRLAGVGCIASRRWTDMPEGRQWRVASAVGAHTAHAVLANSSHVASVAMKFDRIRATKAHVVPNFLDDVMFARPSDEMLNAARAAYSIPSTRPIIGMVANMNPLKNQAMLLRAITRMKDRGVEVHTVLVGDGPERNALQSLAAELDIAPGVTFTGRIPNRPNPNHLFDVSVLCSNSEGLPNSILEAMAAGRPVVATNVGGIPETVEHGVTGFLVEPNDHEALADALTSVVNDASLALSMGEAALRRARADYTADAALRALAELYERVARNRSPNGGL